LDGDCTPWGQRQPKTDVSVTPGRIGPGNAHHRFVKIGGFMKRNCGRVCRFGVLAMLVFLGNAHVETAQESSVGVNQVLEWNQIFIDTLIATNTANSSSQRLGAIVHTAVFDACNGIDSATRRFSSRTAPLRARPAERL
jgi:hypothetical protein